MPRARSLCDSCRWASQDQLVTGSPDNIEFAEIDSLRRQFPSFEIHPIYNTGAWFQWGFNNMISPNFAFLLDGKTVYTFNGDISELQNEFCVGLSKIGLIGPNDCD
jgi:hypothetical protein